MIDVKKLVFSYPKSEHPTLKGLDFEIGKGEVFGFLGPSGAGKSTAQKILCKILGNYEGNVRIDGKESTDWDNSYFEKIGVGFELPNHYLKLTGKENMNLFASFYSNDKTRDLKKLFEMVGLQDDMNKPVENYSKGMKMRLNFIRAIQHDPEILFFDEPTSGLDPVNAQKIREHILDLKSQGKTIFVTTHSMHTADEICDRVAFIVDGQIQVTDSPANLKKQFGKEALTVELVSGLTKEFVLKELGNNVSFLDFIRQGEVKTIRTLDATLDEVFIRVTGKTLK